MSNQQTGLSTEQLAGVKSDRTPDTGSHDVNRQDMHPTQQDLHSPQTMRPAGEAGSQDLHRSNGVNAAQDGERVALMGETEAQGLRTRWDSIQAGFVDEPRRSVEQADTLVAETMQQLAKVFATERSNLKENWSRGSEVSTDDPRTALQKYRSFFQRLLAV